jgi:glycosyltransferase involved in cell wall biosynthesis
MRLGIDVRKLGDGGIGEYIRETLVALREVRPQLEIVAFGNAAQRESLPLERVEWVVVDAAKYSIAEQFALPRAVRGRTIDLFHAPHYVLPLGMPVPAVVTVHDVIHVLYPRSALHRLYASLMIRSACRRARRVIAVSQSTARDLERRFAVPRDKIRVIWNGVAPRFRPLPRQEIDPVLARFGLHDPYVLFVGNSLPHKNAETLLRAWNRLPEPRPDLVLCGRGFASSAPVRRALAEVAEPQRVRRIEDVDREQLVALYNGARLLASASLHEGFCLPVVEAFACGVPVLAPDVGAVSEVAGDAALLVSPGRVDLLADEMYRLLTDQELRRTLVERGRQRASGFSWVDAAGKTLSVYEEVLATSLHNP